jgi:hypothetical protein
MSDSDDTIATAKALGVRPAQPQIPSDLTYRYAKPPAGAYTTPNPLGQHMLEAHTGSPQSAISIREPSRKPSQRNKLVFKNRWLISVDVVAALRRAGVACDIVLPALYVDAPGLTKH